MFTESSNGSGFYPTYSYRCADCGASISNSKLEALSHNHVSMCTACLHGAATFQYEALAAPFSTKCNNQLDAANLLARRHEEVNPASGFLYAPSSFYAGHPLVPQFNIDYRDITQEANNEITKQCEDEINSWLLFNHEGGEEQTNNNWLSYVDVDENVGIANCCAGTQIEYQQRYNQLQPYSFQQGCNGIESIVPVQPMQAGEQHPERLHSFYPELELEAFKAGFIQTPSSWWSTASLPSMDACIVPQETTGSYTYLDSIPQERNLDYSRSTVEIVPTQYCPVSREAKVLRYREKRKARKFEKKIRYSSRKANAERRSRVSGKFARRSEIDLELDQMLSITEHGHAIVPSSVRSDGRNITFGS